MGIKIKCSNCEGVFELPDCPNVETNKFEKLVFDIYTTIANDPKWRCMDCK